MRYSRTRLLRTEGWGLLKVAHSSKNLPSPIQLKLLRSVTGTQEHTFQPNLWPFFALKGSKRLQISWARRKSQFFWKIRVFLHFSFFRRKFNFWPNHDNAFVSSCLKQHQMAKNMHFLKIRVLRSINLYYHFCLICILSFMWSVKKLPRVAQSGTMIKCFLKESTIRIYSRQTRKIPAFFIFTSKYTSTACWKEGKKGGKNRIS